MEFRDVAKKLAAADLGLDVYTLLAVADVVTGMVNEATGKAASASIRTTESLHRLIRGSDVVLTNLLHTKKISAIKHLRLAFQNTYGESLSLADSKNAVESFPLDGISDLPATNVVGNRIYWMISGEEVTDTNRPGWLYEEPPF